MWSCDLGAADMKLPVRRMKLESPNPLVIFMHLPKTAGSTLSRIMGRQYPAAGVLRLYDSGTGVELGSLSKDRLDALRVVVGHFCFGAHQFVSRPCAYVTVLREPVDRVISHYYFVRSEPTHYLFEAAQQLSLGEYVRHCNLAEPNNDQTRLLCGEYEGSIPASCDQAMLELAQRHLRDHFAGVGLTEEFDRTLVLMKRILGWGYPFYVRQNVGRQRPPREALDRDTLRIIQEYNRLDGELYRYGQALFGEQVRRQGPRLEAELQLFARLNPVVGRLGALASRALGGGP
jgi:hypothetical protein